MMPLSTQFTPDYLKHDTCLIFENPLFQALLSSDDVIFHEASGLIELCQHRLSQPHQVFNFRMHLEALRNVLEQNASLQERLQNICFDSILSFIAFKPLHTHNVLTLDEILDLTPEQTGRLKVLLDVVRQGLNAERPFSLRIDACKDRVARRLQEMLHKNILLKEERLNFPELSQCSPSFCVLFINGKISLKQAQQLNLQQNIALDSHTIYSLMMADILTIRQIIKMPQKKLSALRQKSLSRIRVDRYVNQALGKMTQEEAVQFLKNTKNPQTSQSFLFFNHMMKHMERTHITKEVWSKVKERVSVLLWAKFRFFFINRLDPEFSARVDLGRRLKLHRSSEIQAHLANSEGYREYCYHTMFSSRFFGDSSSSEEQIQMNSTSCTHEKSVDPYFRGMA
ncbi:MAG: hypothetical protein P1U39_05125 [Legionellaceae bacterium]|nr:hypothetical protein [Legionellaceae bacterium]